MVLTSSDEHDATTDDGTVKSDEIHVGNRVDSMDKVKQFPRPLRLAALTAASKMLKKRLSSATDMLKSSELWLHTVPSKDCDVVVTFPQGTSEYNIMWLLTRLRSRTPQLEAHLRKHTTNGSYGLYLTSHWEKMLREAETLKIRKKLKAEYGEGVKEFIFDCVHCFEGSEDRDNFLTCQERQSIVLNMLYSLRAVQDEELCGIKFVEGQALVPKCLSEKLVSQVLPLHTPEKLQELKRIWVQAFFQPQPLDAICDYFGVKIAMYFAWLGHYTAAIALPAAFGCILWLCFYGRQLTEDVCFVVFAFFNVVWSTLYLESWKRRCAELAYTWGTLDQGGELLKEPRPLFQGDLKRSAVTGRLEPIYPNWKRKITRYFISFPIILSSLATVFFVMFSILEIETWWLSEIGKRGYIFCLTYVPKILMAVAIFTMDSIYSRIATWLNNLENYRLEEEYENHLIIKMAVFQFVNAFLSLFYTGFYLQDMERLRDLLATLLITRQLMGNIKESCIPFALDHLRLARISMNLFGLSCTPPTPKNNAERQQRQRSSSEAGEKKEKKDDSTPREKINIGQAEIESDMFQYEGVIEDYLEMFIQFGYVILFSSAFPMAAACSFLNNLIEIRSDAFKLCCSFQRPFGQRVSNIGAWQIMMDIMGIIAIVVNCILIGLSGLVHRLFPDISTTETVVMIVVLEHAMLILRFAIQCAIPDVPAWVATATAKVEFKRREALRKMDDMKTFKVDKKDVPLVYTDLSPLSGIAPSEMRDDTNKTSENFAMTAPSKRSVGQQTDPHLPEQYHHHSAPSTEVGNGNGGTFELRQRKRYSLPILTRWHETTRKAREAFKATFPSLVTPDDEEPSQKMEQHPQSSATQDF